MPDASVASVGALVVFGVTVAAVLATVVTPIQAQFKVGQRTCNFTLSYCWLPVLGAALLLALTTLSPQEVGAALLGTPQIQPYGQCGAHRTK
jgi:hypothetical protein